MTAEELKILPHIQAIARFYLALRLPLERIVEYVAYSMGGAPDLDRLSLFLRKEETQRELAAHWEVGLWQAAADKTFRLVSLATTSDPDSARRRLERKPTSPSQCRHCWVDEKGFAALEMRPEKDIHGNHIPASLLHEACMRPWLRLRALVERADSTPIKPEYQPPITAPPLITKRGPGRPRKVS